MVIVALKEMFVLQIITLTAMVEVRVELKSATTTNGELYAVNGGIGQTFE